MTTLRLKKSMGRSPSQLALLLTPLVFVCFALSPRAQALLPAPVPDGGYPGSNTAEGINALHNVNTAVGTNNTALGANALTHNTTGPYNVAVGSGALANDTGPFNTAIGYQALFANVSGLANTAIGEQALLHNTGSSNVAVGAAALLVNRAGNQNTACGASALDSTTGDDNTALGFGAGSRATGGDGNVYVGVGMTGVAGESNHTYIRNIRETLVVGPGSDYVTVNKITGLLGRPMLSLQYQEQIAPMDKASEKLYWLKPVTYRFKKEIDPAQGLEYGLVAEEVAQVDPSLTICDEKGQIENVRYSAINAMLLNEFLKEHRKVEQLEKQIEALTAGLQKVSAQLEASEPAPQLVNNP